MGTFFLDIDKRNLSNALFLAISNKSTKQGNSSIFGSKIRVLYSRAVSNQDRVIMVRVRYINY